MAGNVLGSYQSIRQLGTGRGETPCRMEAVQGGRAAKASETSGRQQSLVVGAKAVYYVGFVSVINKDKCKFACMFSYVHFNFMDIYIFIHILYTLYC